jgi:1,4-alpha-glucan branching enzyme
VAVVGDFNGWHREAHPMRKRGASGIWEIFIAGVGHGTRYKYHIAGPTRGYRVDKADPYGYHCEIAPQTASIVWDMAYEWHDADWMQQRAARRALDGPMSIYEVHIGSWVRVPEDGNRMLTYREIAPMLADYVARMGFTHVELMPVMEHPFYGSWGYQVTGYFAATSRYGTPQDLMFLIDTLHQRGIGVILDWVPSHFPTDAAGLSYFDGTHLYEHADPRQGHQPDWGSYVFNYGRYEVQNFLRSNALFWLEQFHADGLRVDAVASMLHLDFSRREGEWIPNEHGGRENLAAIDFLRRLNESVYREHPDTETIAEDSTAWPMVTRPVYIGGLGFGLKWDMGWMHDTLKYFALDPIHRRYHHQKITFRMMYAFSENYVLPISHDEVVHGKGSLIGKMSGDLWTKRANMRALLGYMYGQTGKKFLFMGCEFGQFREWNHDSSIDWHLLQHAEHRGLQQWVADLNALYRSEPAMHEMDNEPAGFEWVDCNDAEQSIVSFLRYNRDRSRAMLVACNFTPVPRIGFRVGVPESERWDEVLNSDATIYGGSGWGNLGGVTTEAIAMHGRPGSVTIALPPLSVSFFRMVPRPAPVAAADDAEAALDVAPTDAGLALDAAAADTVGRASDDALDTAFVEIEPVEVEVLDVEVLEVETLEIVTLDVDTLEVETPDVETPDVETPEVETPEVESLPVETPDRETLATDAPGTNDTTSATAKKAARRTNDSKRAANAASPGSAKATGAADSTSVAKGSKRAKPAKPAKTAKTATPGKAAKPTNDTTPADASPYAEDTAPSAERPPRNKRR